MIFRNTVLQDQQYNGNAPLHDHWHDGQCVVELCSPAGDIALYLFAAWLLRQYHRGEVRTDGVLPSGGGCSAGSLHARLQHLADDIALAAAGHGYAIILRDEHEHQDAQDEL